MGWPSGGGPVGSGLSATCLVVCGDVYEQTYFSVSSILIGMERTVVWEISVGGGGVTITKREKGKEITALDIVMVAFGQSLKVVWVHR